MIRRVLFFTLLLCVTTLLSYEKSYSPLDSTLLIINGKKIGSGVLISDDGLILTNWHVIRGKNDIKIAFKPKELKRVKEEEFHKIKVLKVNPVKDLALIKIDDISVVNSRPYIEFSDMDSIDIGENTYLIGHPKGMVWRYTKGRVTQIKKDYIWRYRDNIEHKLEYVIQAKILSTPGVSGGPLFNSDMKMIGLNTFDNEKEPNMIYAISIYDIKKFLQDTIVNQNLIKGVKQ